MSQRQLSIATWRPLATSHDRRRAAIVAASAVLHAAILTPMAMGLFAEREPLADVSPPLVFVEMEPRPLLAGETARTPTPSSAAAREQAPNVGEVFVPTARDPSRDEDDEDSPSPPNPRVGAAPVAGAPPTPDGTWQVTPEGMAAAVARSMRTGAGGCRIMDGRLTPGEQQLCDERFNEAAGRARPLGPRTLTPSEQRRDAQFARDGANALARADSYGRARALPPAAVMDPDCPGGNFGGGCAGAHLRPGYEMTDERLRRNRKME